MSILDHYADRKISDEAARTFITHYEASNAKLHKSGSAVINRLIDLRVALAGAKGYVCDYAEEHDSPTARNMLAEIEALLAQDLFAHEKGDEA